MKLDEIKQQVKTGSLKIRQMTAKERESFPRAAQGTPPLSEPAGIFPAARGHSNEQYQGTC